MAALLFCLWPNLLNQKNKFDLQYSLPTDRDCEHRLVYREQLHTCFKVLFKPHIRSYLLWLWASLFVFSKGNHVSYETCPTSDCMLCGITLTLPPWMRAFPTAHPHPWSYGVISIILFNWAFGCNWENILSQGCLHIFIFERIYFFLLSFFLHCFLFPFSFFLALIEENLYFSSLTRLLIPDNVYIVGLMPAVPWTLIWSWGAPNWEKLSFLSFLLSSANTFKPESFEPTKTM